MTFQHPDLSVQLHGEQQEIAIVTMNRPAKRNALNDGLILAIRDAFQNLPALQTERTNASVLRTT